MNGQHRSKAGEQVTLFVTGQLDTVESGPRAGGGVAGDKWKGLLFRSGRN